MSVWQTKPLVFSDSNPVYNAELWDPVTTNFTVMSPAEVPRNYHGIGILLPDGRVFNGGGGLDGNCGCVQWLRVRVRV